LDDTELLSRYFSGEADAAERAQVEAWRQASSENQRAFAEFEKIWQNAAEKLPPTPDLDHAWRDLSARLDLPRERQPARMLPMKILPWAAARTMRWSDRYVLAAAAVLVLGFATILYRYLQDANALQKASAAHGRRESITLPDGSRAHLNSGSEIQFYKNFSDSVRLVTLSGEAYFEVRAGQRPFLVHTDNAQIKVLGTKFGIWARNEQTRVTVSEGRVSLGSLESPQATVVLTANQTSLCRKDGVPQPPQTIDAGHLLGWLDGKIVFDQTSLAEVIAELERVYNASIELANPGLGSHTITGSFHHKPLESVLASVCLTLNLRYAKQGGKYMISE
jgi:ferric-dicitrate binding protein FerR (iron transport regulator)